MSEDDESAQDYQDTSNADNTISDEPLSEVQIEERLSELKNLKKEARRERSKIDERLQELGDNIRETKQEEEKLDAESSALCIAGRNEYSRGAIRRDFAAGIRELDQENAEEEDPDSFVSRFDTRALEQDRLTFVRILKRTSAIMTKLRVPYRCSASAVVPIRNCQDDTRRTIMWQASPPKSRLRFRNFRLTA